MPDSQKILVTGANGFIGSHVVNKLLEDGYEVTTFTRSREISDRNLNSFVGDIRDPESVYDAVSHSDGVINLAGILGTSLDENSTIESVEVNIKGALNVFNACQLCGVRCVHTVVGNPFWLNNYSATKYASERFAIMYNKEHGTKISVLRIFNVYGPGQKHTPIKKAIPNFIINALQNKPLSIYGDGSQKMDYIFVDDVVEIISYALFEDHGVYDNPIEVGTGNSLSIKEIAETIIKNAQSESKIEFIPMRKGEPLTSDIKADTSILEKLGFTLSTSFDEGINKTISYYRENLNHILS